MSGSSSDLDLYGLFVGIGDRFLGYVAETNKRRKKNEMKTRKIIIKAKGWGVIDKELKEFSPVLYRTRKEAKKEADAMAAMDLDAKIVRCEIRFYDS